jgi:hypothetical protein
MLKWPLEVLLPTIVSIVLVDFLFIILVILIVTFAMENDETR